MSTEWLLREVKQSNEIQISQRLIEEIIEFKTCIEVASMESLALILNGNKAIKDCRFDIIKLENWCKKNNLRYYLDDREQILHLKCDNINQLKTI